MQQRNFRIADEAHAESEFEAVVEEDAEGVMSYT